MKKFSRPDWLRAAQLVKQSEKKCNTRAESVIPEQITHRNSGL